MANAFERQENMKKEYPTTKEFFSKMDMNRGSLRDRAKLVVDFIERNGTSDRHCCLAMEKRTDYCSSLYGDDSKLAQFENNDIEYVIFKLAPLAKVDNFRQKVLRAVDLAEAHGGSLLERKEVFKRALHPDMANFIVVEREHGLYAWFSFDNYVWVDRGNLRYYAWVYGLES